MDKNQLIKRLMATFLGEIDEHVRSMNEDMLALEKNPTASDRTERLKSLFRSAHSMKGAARSVNVETIEDACHRLEEILSKARDGSVPLDPDRFSLMFETVDAIEEAGMRLREQHDLAGSPLAALLPRLEAAAAGDPAAFSYVTHRSAAASEPNAESPLSVASAVAQGDADFSNDDNFKTSKHTDLVANPPGPRLTTNSGEMNQTTTIDEREPTDKGDAANREKSTETKLAIGSEALTVNQPKSTETILDSGNQALASETQTLDSGTETLQAVNQTLAEKLPNSTGTHSEPAQGSPGVKPSISNETHADASMRRAANAQSLKHTNKTLGNIDSKITAGADPFNEPPKDQGFVRIPAEKLDALLTRSGELLVAERQIDAWVGDLLEIRDLVVRWKSEWRNTQKYIDELISIDENRRAKLVEGRPASPQSAPVSHPPPRRIRRAERGLATVGENLNRLERDIDRLASVVAKGGRRLDRAATLVDDEVRRVRMLPFAEACQGLERAVRDIAQSSNKIVDLLIQGGDVELDRSVLEGLKDPLGHLVRNAVDHGIEPPDERVRSGKPGRGRVTVSASLRGSHVEVVVEDDGKGLDREAIRRQARKQGIPEPPDDRDLTSLIFLAGFSTASIVTNISGRGVGLDVVKNRLEALHGTIDVATAIGKGTKFTLAAPLTLTTLRAILFSAGGGLFALASTNVMKLVRVDPVDIRMVQGRETLAIGGALWPVIPLAERLGTASREVDRATGKKPGLIVAAGERRMAFLVDELIAEQEIVVKSLGSRIRRTRYLSGATILPSGRIALVLNAAGLVKAAPTTSPSRRIAGTALDPAARKRKRVLVVDDSVTTRTLEKTILESEGFEVVTAVDGVEGLRTLEEKGADLLLCDVDMPRMDGFELTRAVRDSQRFARLPVVLFTSLAEDRDRARGVEVGADAYIVKGGFEQNDLIETIKRFI
jgi:two-component system chemotaxis sensor kinase CheA